MFAELFCSDWEHCLKHRIKWYLTLSISGIDSLKIIFARFNRYFLNNKLNEIRCFGFRSTSR